MSESQKHTVEKSVDNRITDIDTKRLRERLSDLQDGNAWPSTIELLNDMMDTIDALEARVEKAESDQQASRDGPQGASGQGRSSLHFAPNPGHAWVWHR